MRQIKRKNTGSRPMLNWLFAWSVCGLSMLGVPAVAVVQNVDDEAITRHIETQFWTDTVIPANTIDVTTNQGVVTLSGNVDNLLTRDHAQKVAEATVGVRAVINRITVSPPAGLSDEQLQQDIKSALLNDPVTDKYDVNVNVKDGVAVLTGTVDSWQEKQICATVVEGVKGVLQVQNDITFNFPEERPDAEIAREIRNRLSNDVRVDDALIEIRVQDHAVYLSGAAGSLQEKNRAVMDSWIRGVKSVNADDLKIQWWARDRMRRKQLYVSQTDDQIQKAIDDAFVYDPRVDSFEISINADRGTVTLNGVVDNLKAKQAAENDARNTIGVRRIINNIKVRPVTLPSNMDLQDRVSAALSKDPYLERFNLDVTAYSGTVYLSGDVHTSWEKKRARTIAQGVKGVLDIVNNIEFKHQWVWKPDWEIAENVKDQLSWSPFVDGEDIHVGVDNGIVTLTGKVETYSERQTAESKAYEAGAKDVENHLTVTYPYYGPHYDTLDGPAQVYSNQ